MLSESLSAICSILFSNVYALYSFSSSEKTNKHLNVSQSYISEKKNADTNSIPPCSLPFSWDLVPMDCIKNTEFIEIPKCISM